MKGNLYWAQSFDGVHYDPVDKALAISPIFNTKAQYTEWRREAKKNGLKNFRNCQDHMNMHDL